MSPNVNDIYAGGRMSQITARLPEEMINELDRAANALHRSRADVIRQAIEAYLEDFNDLSLAIERLRDPADETVDWQEARRALLDQD
jgi:RHH-type transcriptional regulator, rel operon repressor / antitoxin RelB